MKCDRCQREIPLVRTVGVPASGRWELFNAYGGVVARAKRVEQGKKKADVVWCVNCDEPEIVVVS